MKPIRLTILLQIVLCGLVLPGLEPHRCATGADLTQQFDSGEPSWNVRYDSSRVRLLSHRRQAEVFVRGAGAEHLAFESFRRGGQIRLEHSLGPARVIDELTLSLSFRSNRPGAVLWLRVVFPYQKDPQTGEVLSTLVRGETYTDAGQWQQLECTTTERRIREKIVLERARLNEPNLDTRDLYVDRAILTASLDAGRVEYIFDELHLAPVVSPRESVPIAQTGGEEEEEGPPVEFRLNRLLVEGHPFFPRLTPYHGESPEALKQTGLNVVWVPDVEDEHLLNSLRQERLWATATPPQAVSASGQVLDARNAGLLPFTANTAPILFWNLGTRIPPESKDDLMSWVAQIHGADHRYQRPLMVDVTGHERVVSRQVPMVGVSRHVVNTSFSFQQYRDWLIEKRRLARPGTFVWTWIQTEPAASHSRQRAAADQIPVFIEPEQMRLQVYAALSAGCRGIGYWNTTPFDGDDPAAVERRLAITQLNLELELLEPWLATSKLDSNPVPFEVQHSSRAQNGGPGGEPPSSEQGRRERDARLRAREPEPNQKPRIRGELEAARIDSDYGTLLLPVWYGHDAQFVPGQMVANDATLVVPGVSESASAWEVTTTGVRSLTAERDTGGMRITLPHFDQTAAIIVTSDPNYLRRELQKKIAGIAEKSSRVSIDLAGAKLARVRRTDGELREQGAGQFDASSILGKAAGFIEQAEEAYGRRDYDGARRHSGYCLQLLRILQRAHWNDAVQQHASPVSSPHTVCFQTLPDHWRMMSRLGRSPLDNDSNLLRSGDFEDIDTMLVEGWKHAQNQVEGVRAAAELYPVSVHGRYSLRLAAAPETGEDPPRVVDRSLVTVTTPAMTVRSGQVVYISGFIQVATPIVGNLDGVMIYDSLSGPAGGLRWHSPGDWQRFEMIREVQESGEFSLTVVLNGLGEIYLDDLQVIPHTPQPGSEAPGEPEASDEAGAPSKVLDLWNRVPRLNPLGSRR